MLWPHTKALVVFEKQINKDYTLGCTSLEQHCTGKEEPSPHPVLVKNDFIV